MTAVSVPLSEDLAARLDKLSERTGRSQIDTIREAILEHIEDMEDLVLCEQRLADLRAGRTKTSTLEEVERRLGLVDLG